MKIYKFKKAIVYINDSIGLTPVWPKFQLNFPFFFLVFGKKKRQSLAQANKKDLIGNNQESKRN